MRCCRISAVLFFSFLVSFSSSFGKNTTLACDTAYAGPDQQICGDSTSFNSNTALNGTGMWTLLSGSGTISDSNSDSSAVTGLTTGQNIFVWTISGGGCPTVSDTVIILVDSVPTTSVAGADQQLCADSAILSANTPTTGTGNWTVVSGSGTIVNPLSPSTAVTNLGVGANTFRWKISSGTCASDDDVTITRDLPVVQATAGSDLQLCDTSFFLTGNTPPFGTGMWTIFSGTANINFPGSAGSGVSGMNYGDSASFIWTLSNGVCPSSSDTLNVTIDVPPTTALAGNDQTVCSDFTAVAGNTPVVGSGVWSLVSGSGTITNPNTPGTSLITLGPGQNYFVWSISNGVCPVSADTILINNLENSTPDAGADQVICALSTTLNADTPVIGNGTWSIISGSGSILFASSPSTLVSNLGLGQNVFIWTVSNGICPSRVDTAIVTVNAPSTTANAGADFTVCGSSAALTGSNAVNGTGTWTVIAGSGTFSNANSGSTTVNGMNTGVNTFVWTISNGTCPPSSDTVSVTSQLPPSVADAGSDTTICVDSTMLNANTPVSGNGTWTVVTSGPVVAVGSNDSTLATDLVTGQNIFAWTISSGICPSSSDTVVITVDAMPTAADAGVDINSDQALIVLAAIPPSVGTGVWSNLSSEGNIVTPSSASSSFIVSESGEFDLVWTTSNGVCPSSSDTIHIKTEFAPVPEIITPNGDGENDAFVIKSLQYSSNGIKLVIYNRWGNIVYTTNDYKHDFDGKNNAGEELEEDSYFYHVEANGIEKFKGYLLIKRK
jgi:gliding motility-associated-like protein